MAAVVTPLGYVTCWAQWQGMTADLPDVTAYVERLQARPLCTYQRDASGS
jgi:hypothetical protein